MTSTFKPILKPVLILAKFLGLINFSYIINSDGLLVQDTYSSYYKFLESTRIFLLLILTYNYCALKSHIIVNKINMFKFWVTIVAARISERWIIKLINDIVVFDQKLLLLQQILSVCQQSPSKSLWYIIINLGLVFIIGYHIYMYTTLFSNSSSHLFTAPYLLDFTVIILSCIHLRNIECKFQTLIDFCEKCFSQGLVTVSRKWTHSEITYLMEKIRLLHTELSGLLKTFNLSYGPLLLIFFVFNFIDMLFFFFIIICVNNPFVPSTRECFFKRFIQNLKRYNILYTLNGLNGVYMISILVAASFIEKKKKKIVSYLRLIQSSKFSEDIQEQVKMFMNQISDFEFDKLTAVGFFDINLNLVMFILILLTTGIATLLQTKEHHLIFHFINSTLTFVANSSKHY